MAKTLGRYQVLKHLASGGMAEVLLARSHGIEGFERHVVIKRILGDNAKNSHFVKMFIDEARLAAAIHHQNVVQVHDIGADQGEYFFTMEYVHGEDLRNILFHASKTKSRVPLEHVVTILSGAAAGLHHAHELRGPDKKALGIVHRDVSPANILVGYDGGVKVADFGIAKAAVRTAETRSGVLKGKVAYMSPEQCLGRPIDRRSDIFGLGIVLYELTTVRRLFKGDNDFLTMSMITGAPIPLPSTKWPDIPPQLEMIIMKALSRDPADRYQTANEMRAALEQFARDAGLTASTSALGDWLVQHLGERELPWEAETFEPLPLLDVDFDGSNSGVVVEAVPDISMGNLSSPIARAKSRASEGPPAVPTPRPKTNPSGVRPRPSQPLPIAADSTGWRASPRGETSVETSADPDDAQPTIPVSLDPVASRADIDDFDEALAAARPRRSPLIWIAGGIAAIAAVAIFALARGGSADEPAPAPAPVPSPIATIPTPVAAPPDAAAPVVPVNNGSGSAGSRDTAVGGGSGDTAVGSGSADTAIGSGSADVATGSNGSAPKPVHVVVPHTTPPPVTPPIKKPVDPTKKKKWDPNALFPQK